MDLPTPETWTKDANCTFADPDLPYETGERAKDAKLACLRCKVKVDCLEDAMSFEAGHGRFRWGVWGGLTPAKRHALQRERQRRAKNRE